MSKKKQDRFSLLTKTPKEIFALDKGKFKAPPPMTTPVEKQNHAKFSHGMLKIPVEGGVITLKSSKFVPLECTMVSGPRETPSATKPIIEERVKVAINPEYPKQTVMVGSTHTEGGRNKLCGLLQHNLDIFAWRHADMIGVPRHIAEHRLNVREGCSSVRQKKRGQAADKNQAIQKEVGKLVGAGIMREDGYPLPEIDWKVESLCRFPFKCFLDTYKGYHQIQMETEDEEKTAFITSQGIFCYTKMPFGLRNAGATYQHLVDKAFHKQIGRNLEVYVDDLVIKSHTEDEIVRDVEETFKTLREINMKLNPKKCAFGVEEGMFLGYKVNAKGLKVCPDKVDVVLRLPSPKCLKDVRKLNGKLASLNSDFHWTTEAEEAFKQMKQLIVELPMLTTPMEKEELIVYLAATKKTVSAVLMTKKEAKQMPIYFVSRALRGPKLNYISMEKLVLALVHASKRLKRYFQAHPIVVITDQPIQHILSRLEVAGRLQKLSIELREYAIHYRPIISVKGQILADFIVERPEEGSPDTPIEEEVKLSEPWILFTNGSSCTDGFKAGLILTNPEGMEFTYALRFRTYVAKEADMIRYLEKVKALAGSFKAFSIKQIPISENKKTDALSKIASTSLAVVEEEGDTWMTPLFKYLVEGTLPADKLTPITYPWSFYKWEIDIDGPFLEGPRKVKFLIVAMDYFIKWIEAKPVTTITGNQMKKFVWDNIVCRFGLPREIISDNGKQFRDYSFKDWCEKLCIHQHFASVKHPQTNGLMERANRSLGEGIKASNGDTPFSLTYETEAVIPIEIGMPTLRTAKVDLVGNNEALEVNLDLIEERREEAAIREAKSKAKMEKYYHSKVRNTSFKLGDLVYRNNDASRAKDTGKLDPKWEGPYEVTEALGKGAYNLRGRDGKQLPLT
uniref:Reverse transcriptase domain-containing protein n=1 Tax=Tanacetum cinerariifolium TaxID=118510 RepID=A0A699H6V1_TANCI|nr:reverse transcriptase domain-containing protein [Tanacetum cinerariifolium]